MTRRSPARLAIAPGGLAGLVFKPPAYQSIAQLLAAGDFKSRERPEGIGPGIDPDLTTHAGFFHAAAAMDAPGISN